MANIPNYVCTRCGKNVGRSALTVKKVLFTEMGMGGQTLKARVVGWLCEPCILKDVDWMREPFNPPRAEVTSV
jgi:hypothetical protein